MVNFLSKKEKKLWREAAIAALRTVEDVDCNQASSAVVFSKTVADGILLEYRRRSGNDDKT
jgi:hypothetical protein